MSDEQEKKPSNAKQLFYDEELRKALQARYKTDQTDDRFKELLKRLYQAERKK